MGQPDYNEDCFYCRNGYCYTVHANATDEGWKAFLTSRTAADPVTAARRDLAEKVLEQIEWTGVGNPYGHDLEKSAVFVYAVTEYRKHIDAGLSRLFAAEGIKPPNPAG